MIQYIDEVKKQFRDKYKFTPSGGTENSPIFDNIPDGEYEMVINGKTDVIIVKENGISIKKEIDNNITQLVNVLKSNKHLAIMGPVGCGKNWTAKQILEADGRPHIIIDIDGHADAYHLLRAIHGHESDNFLISVYKRDLEDNDFLNVLKGLLDRGKITVFSHSKNIEVHFTGNIILTTDEMRDKSLLSRFVIF